VDVITYTVQVGDSVFGIAEKFGLRPETILWGNYDVLQDNPHVLRPDQVLNILPVDGTYHEWRAGENFRKVAEFYGVDPQVIVEWPGNRLDPFEFNIDDPQLEPGTMLIIPGGSRPLRDWGPPPIVRTNPAIASTYGPGFCGAIYEGAVGTGTFVWPTPLHYLSGYDYSPTIHPAIDIAGDYGHAIYATDNGVVVYAGWSNYGYGNLIVIDHGNGWQSLYAHLDSVQVGCGMSVFQGSIIGTMGSTGQSTGPHLHFELRHEQWGKVNPWNFLP
jgi:murein DD-endopeptidase MepM/ murein hydrolase activator NlpD